MVTYGISWYKQDIENGEFVRVKTVNLNEKPRVLTLKTDLHYWPTWELRFNPDTAMWKRKTIKSLWSCLMTPGVYTQIWLKIIGGGIIVLYWADKKHTSFSLDIQILFSYLNSKQSWKFWLFRSKLSMLLHFLHPQDRFKHLIFCFFLLSKVIFMLNSSPEQLQFFGLTGIQQNISSKNISI